MIDLIAKPLIKKQIESKDWDELNKKQLATLIGTVSAVPIVVDAMRKKLNTASFLSALSVGVLSYAANKGVNAMIKARREGDTEKYNRIYKSISTDTPNFDKYAAATWANARKLAGKGVKKLFGFGTKTVSELGRGLTMPLNPTGRSIGDQALGFASKGIAGYGAYKGYKYIKKKNRKYDYTTHLRNNVLAGNINPNRLTQRETDSVMKLGM